MDGPSLLVLEDLVYRLRARVGRKKAGEEVGAHVIELGLVVE